MNRIAETDSQIIVYKVKSINAEELLVADVMKSLTVYKFTDQNKFKQKAHYPNG